MAKASEQFRQSDVSTWAITALVLSAVAVFGANLSAVLPQGMLSNLHKTRIEGASVEQLRGQLADMRSEMQRMARSNSELTARLNLGEQNESELARRVGAVEATVPRILESMSQTSNVDRSNVTAGIGDDPTLVYGADGGSVAIRQRPLPTLGASPTPQPLPPAIVTTQQASNQVYGIAVGPAVSAENAPDSWRDLNMKLGPLLFGLAPLLAGGPQGGEQQIVAGPLSQREEATALCARLERISVTCAPVLYEGTPMSF